MAGSIVLTGPDLTIEGIDAARVVEGAPVVGHAFGKPVLVLRVAGTVTAIGGKCTHYGAPLADGVFDGTAMRCPLHHAAFSALTGEALRAPALDPVPVYRVEERDGRFFVAEQTTASSGPAPIADPPSLVVVIGAGAAGGAAVETLRREGYRGSVTLIGADPSVPYDRPNLSKDYLAGQAPEDWIPLRSEAFYRELGIDLMLDTLVAGVDTDRREIVFGDGSRLSYGALLLAPGADPIRLDLPGGDRPHVLTLRTLSDSRAIVSAAGTGGRAVVFGASFIGLEAAASLRARGMAVDVVAPEPVPMARVLGDDLGRYIQSLHEEHGVVFHLGRTAGEVGETTVTLDDGTVLDADLVVMGVGVRPRLDLARTIGLDIDNGILVDEYMATSVPGIWAAGDAASWPDPRMGRIRVEHWAVAQRMGQTAARNILGRRVAFTDAPFFWSQHYDVTIRYVGHGRGWDSAVVDGSIGRHDCLVTYLVEGVPQAVASIGRDRTNLEAELAMERSDVAGLRRLTGT